MYSSLPVCPGDIDVNSMHGGHKTWARAYVCTAANLKDVGRQLVCSAGDVRTPVRLCKAGLRNTTAAGLC